VQHFNAMDFRAALAIIERNLVPLVSDPHIAFDCGTAVASAFTLGAQCCDQLQLPLLAGRWRQLAAIFASFDYQMKGEEYIDASPWPMRWMDSMEGILRSRMLMKGHELQAEPWRGSSMNAALSESALQRRLAGAAAMRPRIAIVSVCDYDPGATPLARLSQINKESYAQRYGYDVVIYEKAPVFEDPLTPLLTEPASHRPAAWSKVDALLTSLSTGKYDWVLWMDCDSFFMDPEVGLEDVVAMADDTCAEAAADDANELQGLLTQWFAGPPSGVSRSPEQLQQWYDDLLGAQWKRELSRPGRGGAGCGWLEPQAAHPSNQTLGWESWLFRERRPHMIASEDGLMLNTGVMLVRASVWSWQFFQKVRAMTFGKSPVTQHPWWEQTAMVYLLQLPFTLAHAVGQQSDLGKSSVERGFAPACFLLSQKHLNTYPPIVASALRTHEAFDAGDFIVSFSGCKVYSSQEVCNQLFLNYFFAVHDARSLEDDPALGAWL